MRWAGEHRPSATRNRVLLERWNSFPFAFFDHYHIRRRMPHGNPKSHGLSLNLVEARSRFSTLIRMSHVADIIMWTGRARHVHATIA